MPELAMRFQWKWSGNSESGIHAPLRPWLKLPLHLWRERGAAELCVAAPLVNRLHASISHSRNKPPKTPASPVRTYGLVPLTIQTILLAVVHTQTAQKHHRAHSPEPQRPSVPPIPGLHRPLPTQPKIQPNPVDIMADVRALLRQQRAARRIEHPHASYSDAGKLVCTVCNESVKTESLWDGHLRSAGHRQRLQSLQQASAKSVGNGYAGFVDESSHKRKLSESDDEMVDQDDEAARRKRTKTDTSTEQEQDTTGTPAKKDDNKSGKPITPPFTRRTSGTPTVGVELQIPSRPATPSTTGTPMSTTPKSAPIGRSPLIPDAPAGFQPQGASAALSAATGTQPAPTTAPSAAATIDEDEWAAFEADLVHGTAAQTTTKPAAAALLDSDAVISAPVMSAAEVAAKSEEEEHAKRRALVDIQIEDEKEDATRALETEFEVMEELEARAKRLRERREALRAQGNGGAVAAIPKDTEVKGVPAGKENAATPEEEDEEEEDDWAGFRFRA